MVSTGSGTQIKILETAIFQCSDYGEEMRRADTRRILAEFPEFLDWPGRDGALREILASRQWPEGSEAMLEGESDDLLAARLLQYRVERKYEYDLRWPVAELHGKTVFDVELMSQEAIAA